MDVSLKWYDILCQFIKFNLDLYKFGRARYLGRLGKSPEDLSQSTVGPNFVQQVSQGIITKQRVSPIHEYFTLSRKEWR